MWKQSVWRMVRDSGTKQNLFTYEFKYGEARCGREVWSLATEV